MRSRKNFRPSNCKLKSRTRTLFSPCFKECATTHGGSSVSCLLSSRAARFRHTVTLASIPYVVSFTGVDGRVPAGRAGRRRGDWARGAARQERVHACVPGRHRSARPDRGVTMMVKRSELETADEVNERDLADPAYRAEYDRTRFARDRKSVE